MYGKVAQWLRFCAVNHDIMGSNPAETVYNSFHVFLIKLSLFIYNHYNAHTTSIIDKNIEYV